MDVHSIATLYMAASVLFSISHKSDTDFFCCLNVISRGKPEMIKTPIDQFHGNCLSSSVMDRRDGVGVKTPTY